MKMPGMGKAGRPGPSLQRDQEGACKHQEGTAEPDGGVPLPEDHLSQEDAEKDGEALDRDHHGGLHEGDRIAVEKGLKTEEEAGDEPLDGQGKEAGEPDFPGEAQQEDEAEVEGDVEDRKSVV